MSVLKINGKHPRYLLDTSALLAMAGDEPGAKTVTTLLAKARQGKMTLFVSCVSFMEAGYKAYQAQGEDGLANVLAYLQQLPVTRVDITEELIALAARFKGTYRLSLADAWILATAKQLGATLVHKDPEFEPAHAEVHLQRLA